ncbi:hypothetical protein ACFSTC_60300 [Nonomuraea ferruginea]
MVGKNSPIKGLGDLKGKHIAVVTLQSVGTLTTEAALKIAGLTADDVRISEMPLPDMIPALQARHHRRRLDDRAVHHRLPDARRRDTLRRHAGPDGELADRRLGHHRRLRQGAPPHEVTSFQRAILKAQADAQDRQVITETLPTYTKISPATAATITLGTFPMDLHPDRIQRVADMMLDYQYIKAELDVSRFLMPLPDIVASPAPPSPCGHPVDARPLCDEGARAVTLHQSPDTPPAVPAIDGFERVQKMLNGMPDFAALYTAVELGVFEELAAETMTCDELAEACGADPTMMGRLLGWLQAHSFVAQQPRRIPAHRGRPRPHR